MEFIAAAARRVQPGRAALDAGRDGLLRSTTRRGCSGGCTRTWPGWPPCRRLRGEVADVPPRRRVAPAFDFGPAEAFRQKPGVPRRARPRSGISPSVYPGHGSPGETRRRSIRRAAPAMAERGWFGRAGPPPWAAGRVPGRAGGAARRGHLLLHPWRPSSTRRRHWQRTLRHGTDEQGHVPAADPGRAAAFLPRLQRAGSRIRPGRSAHLRRPLRRRVGHQRAET